MIQMVNHKFIQIYHHNFYFEMIVISRYFIYYYYIFNIAITSKNYKSLQINIHVNEILMIYFNILKCVSRNTVSDLKFFLYSIVSKLYFVWICYNSNTIIVHQLLYQNHYYCNHLHFFIQFWANYYELLKLFYIN